MIICKSVKVRGKKRRFMVTARFALARIGGSDRPGYVTNMSARRLRETRQVSVTAAPAVSTPEQNAKCVAFTIVQMLSSRFFCPTGLDVRLLVIQSFIWTIIFFFILLYV
jgi:hypothetical protein